MGQFKKKNRLKIKNEVNKILGWKYFIYDALLLVRGQLYWPEAKANTAARGLITRPIRKSSQNDIFIN